jgi:hypothetical protein
MVEYLPYAVVGGTILGFILITLAVGGLARSPYDQLPEDLEAPHEKKENPPEPPKDTAEEVKEKPSPKPSLITTLISPNGFVSVPSTTHSDRAYGSVKPGDITEKTPLFDVVIQELVDKQGFEMYKGDMRGTGKTTDINGNCSVFYAIESRDHPHPLKNMFDVCTNLERKNIAPTVYYLSDSREYDEELLTGHYDSYEVHRVSERFMVLEPLKAKVIDLFPNSSFVDSAVVKKYLQALFLIVQLIERLHVNGYYASNLHASSFWYRESDGEIVIADLSSAEPGYMGKNDFNKDLSVVSELFEHMRWGNFDHLEQDMLRDFIDLSGHLISYGHEKHAPRYDEVYAFLRKYM